MTCEVDILLCAVPWIDSPTPILAPALLKSQLISHGFTARTLDLNIEIFNTIKHCPERSNIIDFFQQQIIHDGTKQDIVSLIESAADRILTHNPACVGLSLLSQDAQFFTIWLCFHLKTVRPDLPIVIGGSGIKNFIADATIDFARSMKDRGLIDDFIMGDGEISIVQYMQGNKNHDGINQNSWNQVENLDSLPFADFDDYDFSLYGTQAVPICDSRGCVRTCEFCDIIEHWKKYKYRSAENIFSEMLYQIDKHGITDFLFYNSLTNGNMKEFNKLLDMICQYNDTHTKEISWQGYFIVRNAKQHPESMWKRIAKSNGTLQLGIESVVEHVRKGLGKNFSNEDIDYHLEMAKTYKVPLWLLLIVGYPTETKQDFDYTKQWFRERARFASLPIKNVICTLSAILPNTELDRRHQQYGIVKGDIPVIWMSQNSMVTQQDRLTHLDQLNQVLRESGMTSSTDNLTVRLMA